MNPTVSSFPLSRLSTFRNFDDGLPWGGNFGSSRFVTAEGPFNPAMVIKWLPLKDMSLPQKSTYTDYDAVVDNLRVSLKRGDRVKAVAMSEDPGGSAMIEGMVHLINYEYDNQRIRVILLDSNNFDLVEVHPETIFREF